MKKNKRDMTMTIRCNYKFWHTIEMIKQHYSYTYKIDLSQADVLIGLLYWFWDGAIVMKNKELIVKSLNSYFKEL